MVYRAVNWFAALGLCLFWAAVALSAGFVVRTHVGMFFLGQPADSFRAIIFDDWWGTRLSLPLILMLASACGPAVWVVATAVCWVRDELARTRRAHGQCPHCGYDLRGLSRERCSECGGRAEDVPCRLGRLKPSGAQGAALTSIVFVLFVTAVVLHHVAMAGPVR